MPKSLLLSKIAATGGIPRGPMFDAAGEEVRFYRANEKPFGAFSNLFVRDFLFEGRLFPTAEHAYQAGKAARQNVREWILSAPSPSLVAMAAHGLYTWDIVSDWSKIKGERMQKVLYAKFAQHDDLRELLLSTGSARIVEAGRTDNAVNREWGEVNGRGQNRLGVLLMELRYEFRKESKKKRRPIASSKLIKANGAIKGRTLTKA